MDILVVIFIAVTLVNAYKESQKAKQERQKRQGMNQQTVYRSKSAGKYADASGPQAFDHRQRRPEKPKAERQPEQRKKPVFENPYKPEKEQKRKAESSLKGLLDKAGNWLDEVEVILTEETGEQKKGKHPGRKPDPRTRSPKSSKKQKEPKVMTQPLYKGQQKRKDHVLIERDEEREKNHKKVTANVKPLKNAFENEEHCEHRIELNPNIQYSKQKKETEDAQQALVRTDKESLIQGIIWSEILGKPKSIQNKEKMERLTGRNRL